MGPLRAGKRTARLTSAGLSAALIVSLVAPGIGLPMSSAAAAEATTLDVSPEHGTGSAGATVTLTARVHDGNGDLYAGSGTSTHVRFFFDPSSANDIDSPGNSPDLACDTGSSRRVFRELRPGRYRRRRRVRDPGRTDPPVRRRGRR